MIIYRNKSIQSFSKNVKLMSVAVGATLISTAVAAAIHTSITKEKTQRQITTVLPPVIMQMQEFKLLQWVD